MAEQEVIFEEAEPADARVVQVFMRQVIQETDYLVAESTGFAYSESEVEQMLEDSLAHEGRLCLVAKIGEKIIGLIHVRSDSSYRISHIGNLFIAVLKDYWGYGIGRILLENALDWAEEMGVLTRLEMTVQVRNERAVHLYQTCGFEIEGIQKRGARTDEGEWLDLYYMAKLIDKE